MRLFCLVTFGLLLSSAIWAENPQLTAARERVKKLQWMVDAGAASRAQLAQAEDEVADLEDDALVSESLRTRDLTEAQVEQMVATAGRHLERRERAFEKAKKMAEDGLATQASLAPLAADLDFARKERDLAEEVAAFTRQLAAMARAEESVLQVPASVAAPEIAERFDGDGRFGPETLARVESAYQSRFGMPLPISAMGETAVHRALGFDHTGRVDVALNPDQPEGIWLRGYLEENHIPYFAFRQAVPGKATGAHIHLGPQSTRLAHDSGRGLDVASPRTSGAE